MAKLHVDMKQGKIGCEGIFIIFDPKKFVVKEILLTHKNSVIGISEGTLIDIVRGEIPGKRASQKVIRKQRGRVAAELATELKEDVAQEFEKVRHEELTDIIDTAPEVRGTRRAHTPDKRSVLVCFRKNGSESKKKPYNSRPLRNSERSDLVREIARLNRFVDETNLPLQATLIPAALKLLGAQK